MTMTMTMTTREKRFPCVFMMMILINSIVLGAVVYKFN
jgi:hypothetical protein